MMARRLAMACFLVVLLGFWSLGMAGEPAGETSKVISGKEIVALQKELIDAGGASSSTRKRRAYKNVVRDGEGLLEKSPAEARRFRVLEAKQAGFP